MVTTAEQIAWTHEFSDGIVDDSGDALLEFMEFAIQWRTANGLPTSAFAGTPGGGRTRRTQKSSRQEGREEDPGKRPPTDPELGRTQRGQVRGAGVRRGLDPE